MNIKEDYKKALEDVSSDLQEQHDILCKWSNQIYSDTHGIILTILSDAMSQIIETIKTVDKAKDAYPDIQTKELTISQAEDQLNGERRWFNEKVIVYKIISEQKEEIKNEESNSN